MDSLNAIEIRSINDMELHQMKIIWDQHVTNFTTSKGNMSNVTLEEYRKMKQGREFIGYFDYRRSNQYLLGFINIDVLKDTYYILQIAVFEDVMYQGIGQQLLDYLIDRSSKETKRMKTSVQLNNIYALNFFFKNEFRILNYKLEDEVKTDDYDQNNVENNLRMVKYQMQRI